MSIKISVDEVVKLTNELGILVNALLESCLPEGSQHLEIVVRSRGVCLHAVELHHFRQRRVSSDIRTMDCSTCLLKLADDQLLQAAILIQICLQRGAVRLIVAMRATNAGMRLAIDGP